MTMALDRLIRGFALKHLSIAVVACALPVTLGAQTTTVSLRDAVFIATGSELFAKNCAVGYCHGSEGRAGRGPRLRDKVWNADKLFGVVHDGIPNTTMPPWKDILPEREIWSIVAYVISIGAVDSDAAAGKVQLSASGSSDLLTDEARKGRELFFDLMNEKRSAPTWPRFAKGPPIRSGAIFSTRKPRSRKASSKSLSKRKRANGSLVWRKKKQRSSCGFMTPFLFRPLFEPSIRTRSRAGALNSIRPCPPGTGPSIQTKS